MVFAKLHQKAKLKIKKRSDFGGFQFAKSEGNKRKNHKIRICGFHRVAKNI
jgi:hypothetical protein